MSEKQLLCAENIKVSYGEQEVLNFEKFQLYEGDRVGLVGANGAGKTTLLKVLCGQLEPEWGTVKMNCDPFYFKQFDEDWDSFELDGKEISTMGVKEQIWQEKVSGGENTRIRLACMFGSNKAVAFLDEPTTNLDVKGRTLLTEKMAHMTTFVVVSHDRALMNTVCNKIVEISEGKLTEYTGNYDDYRHLKEEIVKRQWTEYEKYTAEKKRLTQVYYDKKSQAKNMTKKPRNMSYSEYKMRNLVGRHVPADRALQMEKSAANVLKRIEHMEVKNKPRELPAMKPDFRLTCPPENPIVIRGEHITFGYDEKLLYEDASFIIPNRSKVAILGDNGAGKSTLLNMMIERSQVSVVPAAKIGYISQHMSEIDLTKTVLQNAREVSIQKEEIMRTILARLLLTDRDMKKKAGELSGGERRKLAFAMLFVSDINLIVLDEPTNYMDLPSIEALESLLAEYEGTLVFVSHDMEFVDHIATEKLLVADGKIIKLPLPFSTEML